MLDLEKVISSFRRLTYRERLLALALLVSQRPPEELRGVLSLLSVELARPYTDRFVAVGEVDVLDDAVEVVENTVEAADEDPYEEVEEEYLGQSTLSKLLGHEH